MARGRPGNLTDADLIAAEGEAEGVLLAYLGIWTLLSEDTPRPKRRGGLFGLLTDEEAEGNGTGDPAANREEAPEAEDRLARWEGTALAPPNLVYLPEESLLRTVHRVVAQARDRFSRLEESLLDDVLASRRAMEADLALLRGLLDQFPQVQWHGVAEQTAIIEGRHAVYRVQGATGEVEVTCVGRHFSRRVCISLEYPRPAGLRERFEKELPAFRAASVRQAAVLILNLANDHQIGDGQLR